MYRSGSYGSPTYDYPASGRREDSPGDTKYYNLGFRVALYL